ncbi:helix-turn-helix domain-containing protein [Streptomyces decoyicus]|uniref:helix-turn-helix domain-containing protein n=1 Tax=Streptomyces decoyicus TaxID=249567 RepID=UPI00386F1400|nr:helix-turn-helix domain-containing protein [Streptomyces decoyicus]
MAEKQLSAAVRPHSRVRRSATHTGVTHIRRHQPDRYVIIGNHLAQHRELSLTAVGLGTYILSLPEGTSIDIRTLAARFPEGRDRIAFALRELEAQGYLERVRERRASGHVITRTYAYNDPAAERAQAGVADEPVALPPPVAPPPSPVPDEPPVPSEPPVPPEPVEPPRTPHHRTAVALLAGLRRTDDRLTLAERDIRRLAPALIPWLENGAGLAAIHRTLTARLPDVLESPAGLLARRLRDLLPPPLPDGPVAPHGRDPGRDRPDPFQTCDGCDRAFRAREPGLCRDCRSGPTEAGGAVAA